LCIAEPILHTHARCDRIHGTRDGEAGARDHCREGVGHSRMAVERSDGSVHGEREEVDPISRDVSWGTVMGASEVYSSVKRTEPDRTPRFVFVQPALVLEWYSKVNIGPRRGISNSTYLRGE
jgi:hypothetical protein